MKKLTKDNLLYAITKFRDLKPTYEHWGLTDILNTESIAHDQFFHIMYNEPEIRKHCMETANKVSNRFPLIRLAALYHDTSCYLEKGKMNSKWARNEAIENADQMLRHFEFSEHQRKYVRALIHVHNYNLLPLKYEQPLRQWRKAIIDARRICPTIGWKDILRLVMADCDTKKIWKRKWLARSIIRYFNQQEILGTIVYSRHDLDISTDDIFNVCPEIDNRRLTEVYNHLLRHVAFNGYDYNNKPELIMETVAYIRGKQEKGDILDSRVLYGDRV